MIYREQSFLAVVRSAPSLPPSPSPVSKLCLLLSLPVYRWSSLLTRECGRGRTWSRIIRPQECLGLYKSFNPLWSTASQKALRQSQQNEIYQKQILASSVIRKIFHPFAL